MRVRNKELRARRHRKEQRIKELVKEAIAAKKAGGKPEKKAEPKKAAAKPAEAKKPAAKKPAAKAKKSEEPEAATE